MDQNSKNKILSLLNEIIETIKNDGNIVKIDEKPSVTKNSIVDLSRYNIDINDENWPKAVQEEQIVKTEEQKKVRAQLISSNLKSYKGKILDYGCGDGYVTSHLGPDCIGYDIEKFDSWDYFDNKFTIDWEEIKSNGPYDSIILYDVIDHMTNEDVELTIKNIKEVAKNNCKIMMLVHPWTSQHGGHLYEIINKSHLHLLLNDEEFSSISPNKIHNKVLRPQAYYKLMIEDHFTVKSKKVVLNSLDNWIIDNLVPIISEHVYLNKLVEDQVIKLMSISGIYYDLTI